MQSYYVLIYSKYLSFFYNAYVKFLSFSAWEVIFKEPVAFLEGEPDEIFEDEGNGKYSSKDMSILSIFYYMYKGLNPFDI